MSAPQIPPFGPPPAPPQRPQGIGGCMVAFLVIVGIVLLLPGICSLIFMAVALPGGRVGDIAGFWVVSFVISAFGIAAIAYAIRHR